MRTPGEPLRCQYNLPDGKQCDTPLSGRGRHKWCQEHQLAVRTERQKAGSAQWQSVWRRRHERILKSRKWIYRTTRRVERDLLETNPLVNPKALHRAILRSLREAFDPAIERHQHVSALAILRGGYHAAMTLDYDSRSYPLVDRPWAVYLSKERIVPDVDTGKIERAIFSLWCEGATLLLAILESVLEGALRVGWTGEQPVTMLLMHTFGGLIGTPFVMGPYGFTPSRDTSRQILTVPVAMPTREFVDRPTIRSTIEPFQYDIGPYGEGICAMLHDAFRKGIKEMLRIEKA